MKAARRIFAMLLAFAMVFGLAPASALADEMEAGTVAVEEIAFELNPRYEGILDESDLDVPEYPADSDVMPAADYVSEAEAAGQIREYLKSRTENFTVYVESTNSDYSALCRSLLDTAMAHTGDPLEGDYLQWQYGGYKAKIYYSVYGSTYNYRFVFAVPYYTTAEQEAELDAAVDTLLAQLNVSGKSDYEKVCAVYDYICDNITYDNDNLYDKSYKLKHTAYAALINKTAVCQGYATLLYRLLLELDVDNRLITGIAGGGGHAWNIVELNNLYYDVDSTWDAGSSSYSYFLCGEENFSGHTRDPEYMTDEFTQNYPMDDADFDPNSVTNEPDVTFVGASLSLKGDIGLKFYYELSDAIRADSTAYVKFTGLQEPKTVSLNTGSYDSSDNSYGFSVPLNVKNMGTQVTAQVHNAAGPVGEAKTLSIKTYADYFIANSSKQTLVDLMKAMLNYGAAAQVEFGHEVDKLVNGDMSAADRALPATVDVSAYASSLSGSEEGISITSASLLLQSETKIRVYFKLAAGKSISDYTFSVDGKTVTPVASGDEYYIEKTNVAAKDLDTMYAFKMGGLTLNYCGLSYVNVVQKYSSDDTNLMNLVKALYCYNQAANAYFGK